MSRMFRLMSCLGPFIGSFFFFCHEARSEPGLPTETLVLELIVNGQRTGVPREVGHSDQGFWTLDPLAWQALRLRPAAHRIENGPLAGQLVLDEIPGIRITFDAARQVLDILAPPTAFITHRIAEDADQGTPARADVGAYANYDLRTDRTQGRNAVNLGLELVGFGPDFRVSSTSYYRTNPLASARWTRLDTSVTFSDPATLRQVRLGDLITSDGTWGRPVRMGGIGIGTRFSLNPAFVPFPLPSIKGETAVPSTLDVLLNQTLIGSEQVPAGPFEWDRLPVVTGSGELRINLTDALGRRTELVQPYLVSAQLLRPGLADYSLEYGFIRRDYARSGNHYGHGVLIAQYRQGHSEDLTTEARTEIAANQKTVGGGLLWRAWRQALMQLSTAVSERAGSAGQSVTAELELPGNTASLQMRSSRSSRHFAQLGSDDASFGSRRSDRLSLMLPWSRGGVGYTWVQRKNRTSGDQRFSILTASASLSDRVFMSVYWQLSRLEKRSQSAGINVLVPLDARTQVFSDLGRSDGGDLRGGIGFKSALPSEPGWGQSFHADSVEQMAYRLERRSDQADWYADLHRQRFATQWGAGVAGSLIAMHDTWQMARRIDAAFGLVKVGEFADVPVYRDHHLIGLTDQQGYVVVSDLLPNQPNRIHIDPNDLPIDARYDRLELRLATALGTGKFAQFKVHPSRHMNMHLLGPTGKAVPPGTVVHVTGADEERIIGYDGTLFEPEWSPQRTYEGLVGDVACRFEPHEVPPPFDHALVTPLTCSRVSP